MLEGRQEAEVLFGGNEVGKTTELATGACDREVYGVAARDDPEEQQQHNVTGNEQVAGPLAPSGPGCHPTRAEAPLSTT
jgi:hypothetical protein